MDFVKCILHFFKLKYVYAWKTRLWTILFLFQIELALKKIVDLHCFKKLIGKVIMLAKFCLIFLPTFFNGMQYQSRFCLHLYYLEIKIAYKKYGTCPKILTNILDFHCLRYPNFLADEVATMEICYWRFPKLFPIKTFVVDILCLASSYESHKKSK